MALWCNGLTYFATDEKILGVRVPLGSQNKYQDSSNGSERWHHKPKVVGSNPILDTK